MPQFFGVVDAFFARIEDVEAQPVNVEGSYGAFIQWLTTDKHGSTKYALRRFTIRPGGRIAMHRHKYEETVYVLSGRGVVCAGEAKRSVGPGEYVYIAGGVPHALENPGGEDFVFLCIIPYVDDMRIERVERAC